MPAPLISADFNAWAEELEQRLRQLETPQGPTPMFSMASTALTVANAAAYANCQVFASDIHCPAVSDGVHWYRADTGAQII